MPNSNYIVWFVHELKFQWLRDLATVPAYLCYRTRYYFFLSPCIRVPLSTQVGPEKLLRVTEQNSGGYLLRTSAISIQNQQ